MMSLDKNMGSSSVRVSKKITRVMNLYLKPYQITTEQWSVLRTLHELDCISQKELSIKSDKDQATLTKILDLLEKRKLIKRVSNPNDRRSFLIEITAQGTALVSKLTPYVEKVFQHIVGEIETDKLSVYQEVLESLEKNIEQLLDEVNQVERRQ